jgi:hypothetical protein
VHALMAGKDQIHALPGTCRAGSMIGPRPPSIILELCACHSTN